MTDLEQFSENLRILMARRNIRQRRLAKTSGLTESRINSYYHGWKEPSLSAIIAIVIALDCTFEELTGIEHLQKLDKSRELTEEALRFARLYDELPGRQKAAILTIIETLLEVGNNNKPITK